MSDTGDTKFYVNQMEFSIPVQYYASTCGNCNVTYVLMAVQKRDENDYLSTNNLYAQNGGCYCPYCGSKLKQSPEKI